MPLARNVIHVRASRAEVYRAISQLPSLASGRSARAGGVGQWRQALLTRVGLTALSLVKQAFVIKARGGSDETGLCWAPLSPKTIAYRRRHPSIPKRRPFWTYHPSFLAKKDQRRLWWIFYRKFKARFGASAAGKAKSARYAWATLKSQQAVKTLIKTYGNTPVEILRDTGLLLNSLSPGLPPGDSPPPVPPPKPKNQVFRFARGEVILGTSRKWAGTHHRGIPGRVPRRPLWPAPSAWPARWWGLMLSQARLGVIDILVHILQGAP